VDFGRVNLLLQGMITFMAWFILMRIQCFNTITNSTVYTALIFLRRSRTFGIWICDYHL